MLIGLQLPSIISRACPRGADAAPRLGVVVSLTVIVARFVWVFPATYIPRCVGQDPRARPVPAAGPSFIVSWAGMRGVVSLAAALALAADFPQRDLILYLTFCVIVATLVGQGLTLPWLIRRSA